MGKKRSGGVSYALLAGGLLLAAAGVQAGPATPEMLSNACTGCHGVKGASAGPSMPSIAGQSKLAILEAMRAFKGKPKKDAEGKDVLDKDCKPVLDVRPSTVMGRIAKGYTDAELEAMANYFSGQKLHTPEQKLDKAKVALGNELQEKHCTRCHMENGKEGKDDSPAMAGQWLKYLQIQMDAYTSGHRKMGEKMAEKVKPLSKDELDALLQFYAAAVK